ncbi:hypothetical protein EGH21_18960 [Halomicroarcula sp. F13]|uniref:Uncharacterized protein n=1 Tax=Haloarcula rubra TaxID=2487747 RepID=A0AAW4PVP4_9EURY|nr:hypothetical protein [Halomicroarcula rubra]MBX0325113.1 hypothetical protein [Halomicroarcula rubra]
MPRSTTADDDSTDADDRDNALAEHQGTDIDHADDDPADLLAALDDADVNPLVVQLCETLVGTIEDLQERVEELEAQREKTHEIATSASGQAATNQSRLDDLEEDQEETHEVAKSAIASVAQMDTDTDLTEADQSGTEPSSSPLDFFANCREAKIKNVFVEESNRQNTYRAIKVAKAWPEFATERTDGSGVFMTRDDVETALVGTLGRQPHRQTVARVWDTLIDLGGADLVEKRRCIDSTQEATPILAMDMDTAEGLLEKRYVGLDLIDGSDQKASIGGVTPVVTGEPA